MGFVLFSFNACDAKSSNGENSNSNEEEAGPNNGRTMSKKDLLDYAEKLNIKTIQ